MKILVITYPCSPYRGSEFSVSWNYVTHMSKDNELYVIYGTSGNGFGNVSELKNWLSKNELKNVHFIDVHVPNNRWAKFLALCRKINYKYGSFIQYKYWYKCVYKRAQYIVSTEKIDIVHYLNPIGFKEPGECWNIKYIPYVWGPIQGVENRPFCLYKAMGWKGKVDAISRLILHNGIMRFSLKIRKAIRRADALFAATPNTVKQINDIFGKKCIYLPENGIVKMNRKTHISFIPGNTLRLIWVGAVCERKALILLIEALHNVDSKKWHLDVCGDGSEKHKLQTKAIEYGINDNISWHGNIPRDKVQNLFANAHLHIISSLGEATTTVLFEAMSWAVPTMTLDHCGMSGVVCEKCGIKIPIISYSQVVADMSNKIKQILENPDIINRLSDGVIHCSENFMWTKRVEIFNSIYKKIANK